MVFRPQGVRALIILLLMSIVPFGHGLLSEGVATGLWLAAKTLGLFILLALIGGLMVALAEKKAEKRSG